MNIDAIARNPVYGPAPEDARPARDWLARRGGAFGLFIGGRWRAARSGASFESCNPATGETLARLAEAGPEDISAAIAAARRAQKGWEALGGAGRARYLHALSRLVQKHSRLLAVLESLDSGKPVRESRDIDIPLVARHFHHHAGAALALEEEFPGARAHGVCGQVIPWNFPLLMLAWKVAPALAAGNTVVLKPAEWTPLTALCFATIAEEAGLPAGVLNIVTGGGETGAALVAHEGVDKVAFTGSTEVGRAIRRAIAGQGKGLTLELGGKSAFVVFEDADLDGAIEGLVDAIWFNGGQVCCAGSRLLVQESVAETFQARLVARMARLRVGDPLDKCIDIGAIAHPVQRARILAALEGAPAQGGTVIQRAACLPEEGCFLPPTLVTGLSPAAPLMQEEVFGPVLVGASFRTPAEAVALANDSRYGLAASVWTESGGRALAVARAIRAGVVWVNGTNRFDAAAPFGGMRESGFGREGGRAGMAAYLREAAGPHLPAMPPHRARHRARARTARAAGGALDRTAKLHIGGRQVRPDGGQSIAVHDASGRLQGHVGAGNRKDIRNAVEAARAARPGWSALGGPGRAQVLHFLAENLEARAAEFAARLDAFSGRRDGAAEVAASVDRLMLWGGRADRHGGEVVSAPGADLVVALRQPVGTIGILCPDEAPLLGLVSVVAPALAFGNAVVAVPGGVAPLVATDLAQVCDTSDIPAGVLNIVTGEAAALAPHLAGHLGLDAVWCFGAAGLSRVVEEEAAGNLKRTWVNNGRGRDWAARGEGATLHFVEQATEMQTLWLPEGM